MNTALQNWEKIIKKLSFRKLGGFTVMVTEIMDIGHKRFAMKANIRRLKKKRLFVMGKWVIFYRKILAKAAQVEIPQRAEEGKIFRLEVLGRWLRLKNKLMVRDRVRQSNDLTKKACVRMRRLINLMLAKDRKRYRIRHMELMCKWKVFARKLLQKTNVSMSKEQKMHILQVHGRWNILARKLLKNTNVRQSKA